VDVLRASVIVIALLGSTLVGGQTAQATVLPPGLLTQVTTALDQCLASAPCRLGLGRALSDCQARPACNTELVGFLRDNPAISQILHAVFPSVPCFSSGMMKGCVDKDPAPRPLPK
jgi:hypothetical protein